MSRRTKGVIDRTIAGIMVSSVSRITMFHEAELPGAEAPGKTPGRDNPGCEPAKSGEAIAGSRKASRQMMRRALFKLFLRHLFRCPYRSLPRNPASAQAK